MIEAIVLAAAVAAAPAQAPSPEVELWHSLWDAAYCEGYHRAAADQAGRVDMLRKQLGGAFPQAIVDALLLPGQCPKPKKE